MLPFNFFCNRFLKRLLFAYLLFINASCVKNYQNYGYNFDLSNQNLLMEGVHNQESAFNLMGSPSFVHNFGNQDLWIYYCHKTSNILFLKPKIIETKILLLSFDENKTLAKLEELNGKSLTNLENIAKKNILLDFIENIGKVNSF